LEAILADKRKSLAEKMTRTPLKQMMAESAAVINPPSFKKAVSVKGEVSIIAEMKSKSPSAGDILKDYRPAALAAQYKSAGAKAFSVLTEEKHFGGSPAHLAQAIDAANLPALRKDFIIDAYQIYESRAMGASCVLLIAAILDKNLMKELLRISRETGLDALAEAHDESELDAALECGADMVGINNRNLKDLTINLETTFRLKKRVPNGVCVVSESGIHEPGTVKRLRDEGINAALIGESILKSRDPEAKLRTLVLAGQAA